MGKPNKGKLTAVQRDLWAANVNDYAFAKRYDLLPSVFSTCAEVREIVTKCQLYRGESPFPRYEDMSLREMGRKNAELVSKFDEKSGRPLWSWRVADMPKLNSEATRVAAKAARDKRERSGFRKGKHNGKHGISHERYFSSTHLFPTY